MPCHLAAKTVGTRAGVQPTRGQMMTAVATEETTSMRSTAGRGSSPASSSRAMPGNVTRHSDSNSRNGTWMNR